MARAFYILLVVIPVIVALLITSPLLLRNEIPTTAANQLDHIEIEYTKNQLKTISYGVTERTGAQKTEILYIKNDGETKYSITEEGYLRPDVKQQLDRPTLDSIKAIIKETGFISIHPDSFPVMDHITEYQKSSVKVTLNGRVNQVHWPEQNATSSKIPVIITAIQEKLDDVISKVSK